MSSFRAILLVTALAFAWHLAWSTTISDPVDWDPAYYLDVARNITQGRGAVSRSIWQLSGPDMPLPVPADLHWMPLPSRVLIPGVWLADALGAAVTSAFIAALWVPVAAGLARSLDPESGSRTVLLAASFAALGGGYVRFLSTPDSIALFGLIGGLAWLSAARSCALGAVMACALAALTRGDGFLLAVCVGFVFWRKGRWRAALAVSCAGPAATLAWYARNLHLAGSGWLEARARAGRALHIHDLLVGRDVTPGLLDRVKGVGTLLEDAVSVGMVIGLGLLPLLAVAATWRHRHRGWVVAGWGYALLIPVVTGFLASGVAASGTPFRSGAALFPMACALAADATIRGGAVGHHRRGYPLWLFPAVVFAGLLVGSAGAGLATARARPAPVIDCDALRAAGGVVLTGRPLEVTARCELETVGLFVGESPSEVAARARLHGASTAWMPALDADPLVPTAADAQLLLPTWVASNPGAFVAPPAAN